MLDFHFENQWFPYVVNDMFGEYGVNCKTEYLIFSLLQLKQLGHSVDKVIKMNFIFISIVCSFVSHLYQGRGFRGLRLAANLWRPKIGRLSFFTTSPPPPPPPLQLGFWGLE